MAKKEKNKLKKNKKDKKLKDGNLIDSIQNIHDILQRKLNETYAEFDLSFEQFRILEILTSAPEVGYSLKTIRDLLPNQTSNATRLVEKLSSKQLLKKTTSRTDKRELQITLTSEGISVLNQSKEKIQALESTLKVNLKSKNSKNLVTSLQQIANIIDTPTA